MPGLREAGLLGAAVAIAGGATFLAWSYVTDRKKQELEREEAAAIAGRAAQPVSGSEEVKTAGSRQVLVLGLDGAGKTSVMHCLATGSLEQDVSPTQGINAISINKEDLQIEFLEIGGTETLRRYWRKYLCKALVLVFVVDSTDTPRFPLARRSLLELVAGEPLLPLVVLANKQDMQGACSITELHEALGLVDVGDERKLFLIGTHVKKGDPEMPSSIQDARDFIFQMVYDHR
ncbi:ADP-ribosylation factor-like protein 9 [Brienomyrus brachyistius]|uniref:ADP-ribosylation factor-like protein 9 n=1 Tax=Brienomyrus brachyistius TaxID=42636 RepID=UPI0020B24974|nr:ADP-ribosylation factor-like protein 9 [Brienomyrus brachyistius]XP_048826474.1 ADP-ribosylation factor-like protein 9 [Brienomyrus brachyistius]XP_048826475.1 ADP-ribosylation factor-like protein 9 [Brienomyrus brachyistius]